MPGLARSDVERRGAGDRPIGEVAGGVERDVARADGDVAMGLDRLEPPGQGVRRVGVEADGDQPADGAGRLLAQRHLRGPGEAGQLAEGAVERNAGEGEAGHAEDEADEQRSGCVVRPRHPRIPILAMLIA